MTNTHIVPYMTWNDVNVDLEWKGGPEPMQAKFSPELLMAESLGRQTGTFPCTLTGDNPVRWVFEIRRGFGWGGSGSPTPLHEFGYGLKDCRVVNFWDDDPPMKVSDPDCKWLLLLREKKLMLVLATWNAEPSAVTFTFDTDRLDRQFGNVRELVEKKNEWTRQPSGDVTASDGGLRVRLDGYGTRILEVD
jgi:hypothetical protein